MKYDSNCLGEPEALAVTDLQRCGSGNDSLLF